MSESNVKLGNPAVVGLAGFGLTTLLLQLHNLGLCGLGPVLAMGVIFGGLCQMLAGFQEQKTGNNFGYCAFVGYGAFWIGLCIIWILKALNVYVASESDVGCYLLAWTAFTAILWVGSLRIHLAMTVIFTLLLAGFILLDFAHFGMPNCKPYAAYVLIGCALSAWYSMAAIIYNDLAGKTVLPFGRPFIAKAQPAATPVVDLKPTASCCCQHSH